MTKHRVTIAVIAAIGAALAFYATSFGVGTDVDSATYLMAARNLLAGKGLALQTAGSARMVPLTSFPPLLPMILAGIGYIGIDPLVGARWLGVVLYGTDIFLIGVLVKRYTRSNAAAILSALLMTTTVDVLVNHCMLISEPLFLFCVLAGLILIARYIETPTLLLVFGFSAAFAAAGATRYIGITLLPVGAGVILFGPWPSRLRKIHIATYMSVFACPLIFWAARNMILVRAFTDRIPVFHPPGLKRFELSYLSLSTWILPSAVPQFLRLIILTGATMLLLRPLLYRQKTAHYTSTKSYFDCVLIGFLCLYVLGFVVAQTFFDAQIWILGRHLLFVYVIGSMIVISQGRELFNTAGPKFRVACWCLCIAILGVGVLRTGKKVLKVHEEGIGLSSKRWQTSELVAKTRELDSNVPIISNSRAAIYLLTGKLAYPIPVEINSQTGQLQPGYAAEIATLEGELQHAGAVIVYFTAFEPAQAAMPAENDLETQLGLRRFATTRDGYMLTKSLENVESSEILSNP